MTGLNPGDWEGLREDFIWLKSAEKIVGILKPVA
jgi:hypothetical protein